MHLARIYKACSFLEGNAAVQILKAFSTSAFEKARSFLEGFQSNSPSRGQSSRFGRRFGIRKAVRSAAFLLGMYLLVGAIIMRLASCAHPHTTQRAQECRRAKGWTQGRCNKDIVNMGCSCICVCLSVFPCLRVCLIQIMCSVEPRSMVPPYSRHIPDIFPPCSCHIPSTFPPYSLHKPAIFLPDLPLGPQQGRRGSGRGSGENPIHLGDPTSK